MNRLIHYMLIAAVFVACQSRIENKNAYKLSPQGFAYRLLGFTNTSPSATLQQNQIIHFSMTCKTVHDSLFWSTSPNKSYASGLLFVNELNTKGLLRSIFQTFTTGDSVALKVNPKVFFAEFFKLPAPWFIDTKNDIQVNLKIINLVPEQQLNRFIDSCKAVQIEAEKSEDQAIRTFIETKKLSGTFLKSGVFKVALRKGLGPSVDTNQTVRIAYRGSFLDGQIFDRSLPNQDFDFKFGNEYQVIFGLHEGIKTMKVGEIAKFIIPSRCAFGALGSSTGIVGPHSTVCYEVELKNIH